MALLSSAAMLTHEYFFPYDTESVLWLVLWFGIIMGVVGVTATNIVKFIAQLFKRDPRKREIIRGVHCLEVDPEEPYRHSGLRRR